MTTKCNACGAPQPYSENSKCIYCGDTLNDNEIENDLLNDFILIKYEYSQENYEKVIKLADKYLEKNKLNIPCWVYKFSSEFLKPIKSNRAYDFFDYEYDINKLTKSIDFILKLNLKNSVNVFIESQIIEITTVYFEHLYDEFFKTSKEVPFHIIDEFPKFISFCKNNFSNNLVEFLNMKWRNIIAINKILNRRHYFLKACAVSLINKSFDAETLNHTTLLGLNSANRIISDLEMIGIIIKTNKNNWYTTAISKPELKEILIELGYYEYDLREINFEIYESFEELKSLLNNENVSTKINKGNGNCFIATATLGSYDHPVVVDLRIFRDEWLLKRKWGIKFTNWYYTYGPNAARLIEKSILLKKVTFYLLIIPLRFITKKIL